MVKPNKRNAPHLDSTRALSTFNKADYSKSLPPFGKRLVAKLQRGEPIKNDVFIYCGEDAIRKAKIAWYGGNTALVYLLYEDPAKYYWPVEQQSVLIFDLFRVGIPIKQIKLLAFYLLKASALVVRYVHPAGVNEMISFTRGNHD